MKKFLAALLGLLLLAAPAAATNYNVYTDAELTAANDAVAPGDTVFLATNTYTVFPCPTANGTASQPIVYMGKMFARDSVVIDALPSTWNGYFLIRPYDTFQRKYVRLYAMKFLQDLTFDIGGDAGKPVDSPQYTDWNNPYGTQLHNVTGPSISLQGGAHDVLWDSVYVTAATTFRVEPLYGAPYADTISNSSFVIHPTADTKAMRIAPDTHLTDGTQGYTKYYIDSDPVNGLVFNKSRFLITIDSTVTANAGCWDTHNMRYSYFTDCYFELTNLSPATDTGTGGIKTRFLLNLRDGSRHNTFLRDTFYVKAGYPGTTVLSNPGQVQMCSAFNKFTQCVFKNFSHEAGGAAAHEAAAIYLWPIDGDTLSRCRFIGGTGIAGLQIGDGALDCPNCPAHTAAEIDHCTFYADPTGSYQDIVALGGGGWGDDLKSLTFKNNLIYNGAYTIASSAPGTAVSYWYSASGGAQTADKLKPNHAGWYGNANKATLVGIIGTAGQSYSAIPSTWHSGHPGFKDTTIVAFNDSLLTSPTLALTTDEFGGASGAWIAPDVTRPYAVTDLHKSSVNDFKILLAWTATGDDSITGTPTYYEVRYATTDISDETKWNAATYGGQLRPAQFAYGAGTEDIVVNLTGKAAGNYYFAVKAYDEAGNPSAVSNRVLQYMSSTGGGGSGPSKIPDE